MMTMCRKFFILLATVPLCGYCGECGTRANDVVVETETFRFVIGDDASAKSLVVKATGEECLEPREHIPVFATIQARPYNNEVRLATLSKRTTYRANRVRREGDLLYVGFKVAPYEAVVRVKELKDYATFTLERLVSDTVSEKQYRGWNMDVPPVAEFRVLQLPVKNRRNFGDWLNVAWDDRAAVAVLGGTPFVSVDHEERWGFNSLHADLVKGLSLVGGTAVLVAAAGREPFLDAVDRVETDLGLPRGVRSRRDARLNASIYWTEDICPANVDEHIALAKKGGFRMMLIYYTAFTKAQSWKMMGDYSFNANYPNGVKDVRFVLDRIKAAGLTPGFHTLQTFIGHQSGYCAPEADHRLLIKRHFTLAKPLPATGEVGEIVVEQNPLDAPQHPKTRILRFGTELFTYEGYETECPYRFTGVKRGHLGTTTKAHPLGEIGGVLEVSEAGAVSFVVDQETSLQDEIAEKIARICDEGMEFCYFDGSEDANQPCGIYISLSQYRVAKRLKKMPVFTEGCARSHFGWHLQSGANAFDVFRPELFKEKIVEYPLAEAPVMAQDFTRLDFGWWGLWPNGEKIDGEPTIGTQPDMWEYGTSKAAAWDSPATVQVVLRRVRAHRRLDDLFATMRRWEDVRARRLLTAEQKEMLKDPKREFHLVEDGKGGYDLVEWRQLVVAGGKWTPIRAFVYERDGRRVVTYWHVADKAKLLLPDGLPTLEAEGMKQWETDLSEREVRRVFAGAVVRPVDP